MVQAVGLGSESCPEGGELGLGKRIWKVNMVQAVGLGSESGPEGGD